ncbi:serine hydrolase domain-containing protein [Streptomyces sp. NPDC050085]|uniref:serine hydrolase domain-containing protein n=1 Tax=Streptomyces sp. NPDC050085 TaxID=3365600 RepID=UPI0037B76402
MPSRMRPSAARTTVLLLSLLLLVLLVPSRPAAAASAPSDRYAAIDAYVRERMKATGAPGVSYAVVGPNGPLHQRSWGSDGRGSEVTARTPFLWGSVAKPVAATAVMTLVQDGRLRLDDRVVDHVPGFRFGGAAHARRVTVRHLLGQTAGIPESATFAVADCLDADCPRAAERVRALDDVRPLGLPGTIYAYSSANYLVLAAVVEAVTGQSFAAYLRTAVFAPAGMRGAVADRASARERRLSAGHQRLWGIPAAIADGVDDAGAAYGYTGGDLGDLAAFAALQLRAGSPAGARDGVLTPASVRAMRTEGRLSSGYGTGYGLGWRVGGLDAPLDHAVWHTGATPGYSAMLFLLPETDTALVLQQNLYGLLDDDAVMRIGFDAARILAGGTPSAAGTAWSSPYYLTVWGTTALALLLCVAAGRSVVLLRRPAGSANRLRRLARTVPWCVSGALPLAAFVWVAAAMGLEPLWLWLPDVFLALCAATAFGVATVALRVALALRPAAGPQARSRTSVISPYSTTLPV